MTAQEALTSHPGWLAGPAWQGSEGSPLTYYNGARVVAMQHQVVRPALGRPDLDCDPKATPALQGRTGRDLHGACKQMAAAGVLG